MTVVPATAEDAVQQHYDDHCTANDQLHCEPLSLAERIFATSCDRVKTNRKSGETSRR